MKVGFFQLIVKVIKSQLSHKARSDIHFNRQIVKSDERFSLPTVKSTFSKSHL